MSSGFAVGAAAGAAALSVALIVRSRSGRDLGPQLSSSSSAPNVADLVRTLVSSTTVVLFSKTYCPFCRKVKALFAELGLTFGEGGEVAVVELDVTNEGAAIQQCLLELTGQRTVPSVWIKGQHIGGNDDTQALFASGALHRMTGMPFVDQTPSAPSIVAPTKAAATAASTSAATASAVGASSSRLLKLQVQYGAC